MADDAPEPHGGYDAWAGQPAPPPIAADLPGGNTPAEGAHREAAAPDMWPPYHPNAPKNGTKERSKDRAKEKPPPEPLRLVNPTLLATVPVPERQWIVPDWLPGGCVTSLYGDGGVGKTLLAQQLMASCATGRGWGGLPVERCNSLGLFCEDDEDELHRRQEAINGALGLRYDSLGAMRWVSGVGADNLLMTFSSEGRGELSHRFLALEEAAIELGARLVVIDTAADTFGGNENDRSQVRQYIGHGLSRLAQRISGAVLLCAHPSRSGLSAVGDLDGGSTGWSNSVRSRLSLTRPAGDDAKDTPERILTRRKANYASIGAEVRLTWKAGALMPTSAEGGPLVVVNRREAVQRVFLEILASCTASGMALSESRNAGNFAPKIMERRPEAGGFAKRDFETAMHALMASGRIRLEIYGRTGDARKKIVPTAQDDDEGGAE